MQADKKNAVVTACQIMIAQKLDSGPFGNISIRDPERHAFWVNPAGLIFSQLTPQDILLVDLNGVVLEGHGAPHPGAFIHREIYRRRKDIFAIVHTHSENTVAHSLLGCTIEPYTQLGAAFYGDQGLYTGFTGPVRDSDEGGAIANALGNHAIVIAKNHGLFATGQDIKSAVWNMVVADLAARVHVLAKQMGLPPAASIPDEHILKSKMEVRDRQCEFMWDAYVSELQRKNLSETFREDFRVASF